MVLGDSEKNSSLAIVTMNVPANRRATRGLSRAAPCGGPASPSPRKRTGQTEAKRNHADRADVLASLDDCAAAVVG